MRGKRRKVSPLWVSAVFCIVDSFLVLMVLVLPFIYKFLFIPCLRVFGRSVPIAGQITHWLCDATGAPSPPFSWVVLGMPLHGIVVVARQQAAQIFWMLHLSLFRLSCGCGNNCLELNRRKNLRGVWTPTFCSRSELSQLLEYKEGGAEKQSVWDEFLRQQKSSLRQTSMATQLPHFCKM